MKSGDVFGRLTALSKVNPKGERAKWLCRCSCGREKVVGQSNLVTGITKSCGCIKREQIATRNRTHGLTKVDPGAYRSWKDMRARCFCETRSDFHNYGGRGIKISPEWADFSVFYRDMGSRPDGFSIDRINVNGDYEASNCRWADDDTQRNNKRASVMITHKGVTRTLNQWARHYGIERTKARYRLSVGMTFEEAFSDQDFRYPTS